MCMYLGVLGSLVQTWAGSAVVQFQILFQCWCSFLYVLEIVVLFASLVLVQRDASPLPLNLLVHRRLLMEMIVDIPFLSEMWWSLVLGICLVWLVVWPLLVAGIPLLGGNIVCKSCWLCSRERGSSGGGWCTFVVVVGMSWVLFCSCHQLWGRCLGIGGLPGLQSANRHWQLIAYCCL